MAKLKEADLAYTNELPGAERGNPSYFENEVIDHLLGIVLELGAQFWVLRDRQAFLEEQLAAKGVVSLEARFRFAEGVIERRDSIYVVAERDRYEDYNLGLRFTVLRK